MSAMGETLRVIFDFALAMQTTLLFGLAVAVVLTAAIFSRRKEFRFAAGVIAASWAATVLWWLLFWRYSFGYAAIDLIVAVVFWLRREKPHSIVNPILFGVYFFIFVQLHWVMEALGFPGSLENTLRNWVFSIVLGILFLLSVLQILVNRSRRFKAWVLLAVRALRRREKRDDENRALAARSETNARPSPERPSFRKSP